MKSCIDTGELYDPSFISVSHYLKECCVENYTFMLQLFNRELLNVDPYDPDLSDEMKRSIIMECEINIWYFLRNVVRVPLQGGGFGRFKLNKQNCAQIFCYTEGIDSWSTTASNLLRETNTICIQSYHALFNTGYVGCYSTTNNKAKELFYKLDSIVDNLPEYIKPKGSAAYLNEIKVEKEKVINPNCYILGGICDTLIHFSEAEYITCIDKIYNNENKIANFIFESSCNRDYDLTGAKKILDNSIQWNDSLYDIIDMFRGKVIHIQYEYIDLFESVKESEKWFNDMIHLYSDTNESYISTVALDILLKRPDYTKEEFKQRKQTIKRNVDFPVATKYSITYRRR